MAGNKFSFGNTKIKIQGVNFAGLMNELNLADIKLKKVERKSATELTITCSARNCSKILAILKGKCYTILEQRNSSFFNLVKMLGYRLGLLVGIGLGVLLSVFSSFFLWDIMVNGQTEYEERVYSVLAENGIGAGSWKFGIQDEQVEQLLYNNIPELSLVDVSFRGCSMLVNYTIRTPANEQDRMTKNLVAKSDGVVASILTTSGTALVKVGDFVRKGQVLIAGYEVIEEQQIECNAKGQVFAYTWKSATVEFSLEKIEWVRTDNFVENVEVSLFGSTFYTKVATHNFERTESVQKIQYLLPSSPLPLQIKRTIIYQLDSVSVIQDYEENEGNLKTQAKMLAWELIQGEENILSEKTEVNFASNIWFITHYIKIKDEIS